MFIFTTPVLIRHLWQLKTVVILHWCLICSVPFVTLFIVSSFQRESMFVVPHFDINSLMSGLLHLTGQPNNPKDRATVRDVQIS